MIKRVAIYGPENNSRTRDVILKLVNEFCGSGVQVQVYEKQKGTAQCPGGILIETFSDLKELKGMPDLVLSIGGDGTFLDTMLKVRELGIPIAGINTGRLGFLANISEDEITHSIGLINRGEYEIIKRSALEISKPEKLFETTASVALNEITIQKADLSMITINVLIDDTYLNTYWADGLIISTATGSTAYNLSAGGPILSPEDESIIISPISPHNLTIRPIVVSGKSRLRMSVEGRGSEFLVTCDFRYKRLAFGTDIEILQSPDRINTVMLNDRDFYSTLRNKLMWGADKRN